MRERVVWAGFVLLAVVVYVLPGQKPAPKAAAAIDAVLTADFADPSILRVGTDYYMTHSSYGYVPGLLVWHSRDLVRWERVGYALEKHVGEVWAPDLVKQGDTFYIYFPAGRTNWVVTAPSPEGPWSDPMDLKISGIDPGHIATPDGKRYLYQDDGYVVELAADGLSVSGKRQQVYRGWKYPADWTVEGFYLESPKLLLTDGYYYLTSAQGGTAGPGTSHMAVQARARSPLGPWENSPFNPIVRTWSKRENYLSKGHGTVFQDAAGKWFIAYHAYENGYLPAGRQTLIEPLVRTKDGWFQTLRNPKVEGEVRRFNNVVIEPDDFSGDALKLQWQFSGIESLDDVRIEDGALTLETDPEVLRVLHATPGDHNYEASVRIETEGDVEAGFVVYYGPKAYAGLAVKDGFLFNLAKGEPSYGPFVEAPKVKYFKLRLFEFDLTLLYSEDGLTWTTYPHSLEVSGYHHNMLGGFSSLKIGVYGRGNGSVRIDDFFYRALD